MCSEELRSWQQVSPGDVASGKRKEVNGLGLGRPLHGDMEGGARDGA